jgi:hypothetical protein
MSYFMLFADDCYLDNVFWIQEVAPVTCSHSCPQN